MSCPNIFDAFRVATEYLGPEVYKLAAFQDPWLNLVPRSTYAANTGLTHSVFRVNRAEPTSDNPSWQTVTLANGGNAGACDVTYADVSVGFDEFTYSPERYAWRGPVFCKDDLYFDHSPERFLEGYVDALADRVRKDIANRYESQYRQRVPLYVAQANFNQTYGPSTTLTAPAATSELTQEMLDTVAANLIYERATNPDTLGYISLGQDGPVFSLGIGTEASQLISLNNSEFRQDQRWAEPSILMKRLGATKVIKNFRHLIMPLPGRFTHDGTKYVPVNRFKQEAATKGYRTVVNDQWISPTGAPYECAVVLSPYVMTSELIAPSSNVGPLTFDPSNYLGEWIWKTGPEALAQASGDACGPDPLHKRGRHFAEFMHALRPGALTRSGAVIFYKRCPTNSYSVVTCS